MSTIARIAAWQEELMSWRRTLHANPELAFAEHRTSEFVAERLTAFGLQVHRGLAGTGVVASLTAGDPAPAGRAIGLRADMDALPLQEANERLPWRSTVAGRMHGCGHDGHVTMLLGAARYLAETRHFSGTVRFIFQPAEECEGGGRVMVEQGLFELFPVDTIYGIHNWPGLPAGHFGIWPGPIMGAFDTFEIVVHGRGGHGSQPHLVVDPIVAAAQLVTALQTVVSRNTDPLDAAVISVTQVSGGDTFNIVPEQVLMRGGARALRPEVRDAVEQGMRRVCAGVAAASGTTIELNYHRFCPATVSTAAECALAAAAAADIAGEQAIVRDGRPSLAAEDFAFLLHERPGCYLWLGNGPTDGGRNLHSPHYDFNDELLAVGASFWVRLVERGLAAG